VLVRGGRIRRILDKRLKLLAFLLCRPRHSRQYDPLGLKGAGEGGINGGVIASAIDDALGTPGAVTQLPMSPQRVKGLLRRR
jgi:carbon-monoxide dehydrogenase large subunit/6-hydroxypseudooxynicotine dehydrogenase subunit gamma